MASANGTTIKTGNAMKRTSAGSRPATGGNKRVVTSRKGQSNAAAQKGATKALFRRTHAGPYGGN